MWATATIGVALGYGFYFGGILTAVICVVNATLLTRVEDRHLQALIRIEGIIFVVPE